MPGNGKSKRRGGGLPKQGSLPHVPPRLDKVEPDSGLAQYGLAGGFILSVASIVVSDEAGRLFPQPPWWNEATSIALFVIAGYLTFPGLRQFLFGARSDSTAVLREISKAVIFILIGAGAFLNFAPDDATTRPFPNTVLSISMPEVLSGLPVISPQKAVMINVGVSNQGPGVARDVNWAGTIQTIRTPLSMSEEESFFNEISKKATREKKSDLVPGRKNYSTLIIRLDEEQIRDIQRDEKRVYIFTKVSWVDSSGKHESASCFYLQPPGTKPVWRLCGSHNYVR